MYVTLVDRPALELLYTVIDAVFEQAYELNLKLTVAEIAHRLCIAYRGGERDPEALVDAIIFGPSQYLH
jgi:hypothetical protein